LIGRELCGVVDRALSARRRLNRPKSYKFLVVTSDAVAALEWERVCCCWDM
jgi:hypothetical protein